jgi:RibD C-terminal domain
VFSKTLTKADWAQSTIASGDLADEIGTLKRELGKDLIAWGGAAFAHSLTGLRLVDEYRLVLQPVALGDGLPLFAGSPRPSCSTPLRPGHTPTARCSTSTARLPDERSRVIEASEVGTDIVSADLTSSALPRLVTGSSACC